MELKRLNDEDRKQIKQKIEKIRFVNWFLTHKYLNYPPKTHLRIIISMCCFFSFFDTTLGGILFSLNAKDNIFVYILEKVLFAFCNTKLGTCEATTYTNYTNNIFYNIILWHFDTHHFFDILSFALFYWIFAWETKSFIYPVIMVGAVIGTNEYIWWFSYIIAHYQIIFYDNQWELIYFSNAIAVVYAIIILLYVIIKGWSKDEWKWIGIIIIFYIFWIAIGFPITYGFSGATQYLLNIPVNLIEVTHWYWAFIAYLIIVNKKIKHRIFS